MINKIQKVLKKYWGYDSFLPLQREAMQSAGTNHDSLVVLPTGGGKSLCYQAPAVTMEGMAIVVSPLISLMKDQVDSLNECGIPAARIDSTQNALEQRDICAQIRNNQLKLLYVSPERLIGGNFLSFLTRAHISMIAIDEAHCVSMWGHDFRPEYHKLSLLKQTFPNIAVHAYTATATEQVRMDIIARLTLDNPTVLIGSFDRPNLTYKFQRRDNLIDQLTEIIDRHQDESGIIYRISRKDVEETCQKLCKKGYRAAPYHAGMEDNKRQKNQDAFIKEKVDIIVATIAFGMGIDKSNVRYVIHAGMPKSLENYQQESGRAGRDGLEAECHLIYSGNDFHIWSFIMQDMEARAKKIAMDKLNHMFQICSGITCRHQAILSYFDQSLDKDNCGACDVCLGEVDTLDDAQIISQKILSNILRLDQHYGAEYNALVLTGSRDMRILENRHDQLSTYGLLSETPKKVVRDWIGQLTAQGCIKPAGEYNVLNVAEPGWDVLRGKSTPRLLKPAKKKKTTVTKSSSAGSESWQGVDRALFEILRILRRDTASSKGIPAYLVFGDTSLRDMARLRPTTPENFLQVHGVGEQKHKQYGKIFMKAITRHCQANNLEMNVI
ncbi:MAG: DNA helicase RecQ [Phycisphaerae bacterium]|nr:DNA helicase RecQ [Phycisphaerae bacterium]